MARIPLGIETDAPGNYQTRLNKREKKVLETLRDETNVNDSFECAVTVGSVNQSSGAAYTGAAAETVGFTSSKAQYEMYVGSVATGAAAVGPYCVGAGLEIKLMAGGTGPDHVEIGHGITADSRACYTVGSLPEGKTIFFETEVTIDDISDVTQLWMGWRKAEAYQATDPDAYDEMAAWNIGEDADGQIEIHTILNNAATVTTDTTETDWADGNTKTLRVEVDNTGLCTFLLDGVAPTVDKTDFSFDSGEVIIPFFRADSETGDPGINITSWKVGTK